MLKLSYFLFGLSRQSILRCGDNTGITKACIIGLSKNRHGTGKIGDRVRLSVRDKEEYYKGEKLPKGIIIRRKKETNRKDGSYIKFSDNSFIVISNNKPKGNKIKGPVPMELLHSSKNLARHIL